MADSHGWTGSFVGTGFTEVRERYFDANNRLIGASITVSGIDSSTISQVNYEFLPDGSVNTTGQLQYPDGTHASAHFHPDGRFGVVHSYGDGSSTTWAYEADGACLVQTAMSLPHGRDLEGTARTWWSLLPDGSPVGDFHDDVSWLNTVTGEQISTHTVRTPGGATTVTIQKWDASGSLIENSTTTTFAGQPDIVPTEGAGTRPTPPTSGTRPTTGGKVTTTRRAPLPILRGGLGWTGGGGGADAGWLDWWLETPDGRTVYLGATMKTAEGDDDD